MNKYKVMFTYSEWENGQGWTLRDSYMGIDDVFTDDETVLDYDKDDLMSDMRDFVQDEIEQYNDDSHDTCYTYTVYDMVRERTMYSVSVNLSELANS